MGQCVCPPAAGWWYRLLKQERDGREEGEGGQGSTIQRWIDSFSFSLFLLLF